MRAAHKPAVIALAALTALTGGPGCADSIRGPLAFWVLDEGRPVEADATPWLENETYSASLGEVRLSAAINEVVAFQLVARSSAPPAGPFHVRVGDLSGSRGVISSVRDAAIFRAVETQAASFRSWYPEHVGRPALPRPVADLLVPWDLPRGGGPLRLDLDRAQRVWVDVRVPPTAAPGEYVGRLDVVEAPEGRSGASAAVFSATIRLRVMPVALPGEPAMAALCRVDPTDLLDEHFRWPRMQPEWLRLSPDSPSHLAAVRLVQATMRLLHEHRTTPVLWASFPKIRPSAESAVEVDWAPYEALVAGWIDGSAYADGVRSAAWPLPVSTFHPDARANGGIDSPRYARLLGAYLADCERYFEQRGWLDRAFLRPIGPQSLTADLDAALRRAAGIARQAGVRTPLVGHVPAESPAGLGWYGAPPVDSGAVGVIAPPASWLEPRAVRERGLGRPTWMVPDAPPYSPTLAIEGPQTDPTLLPWVAARYELQGVWIEDAARTRPTQPRDPTTDGAGLVYPAATFGLFDSPLASVRLKRLRRGLQDVALLRLLERNGRSLLARRTAERVVRRALTDACVENLLSTRAAGWTADPYALWLTRRMMLQELAEAFDPAAADAPLARLADWERVFDRSNDVSAEVAGVRVTMEAGPPRGIVLTRLANDGPRDVTGRWSLHRPPVGWRLGDDAEAVVPGDTRHHARLRMHLASIEWNQDGVMPFELHFESATGAAARADARLAVTGCPTTSAPPVVDGDLADFPRAAGNCAGDFRLVRGGRIEGHGLRGPPALPTWAYFCRTDAHLYVGVHCALPAGESPRWDADNRVPVDGAVPWGQDVVEVLIEPSGIVEGASSDLYCLQIKPSGLLVASRGCPTDPPMGSRSEWQSGARVAVRTTREAWTVELSLPIAALGPAAARSRVWGLNVTRLDARRGDYSSWSGCRGHCYLPQRLGNLLMGG